MSSCFKCVRTQDYQQIVDLLNMIDSDADLASSLGELPPVLFGQILEEYVCVMRNILDIANDTKKKNSKLQIQVTNLEKRVASLEGGS